MKRIESTIRATRTETVRQRLSRAAKQRARQNICGRAEVRVIEDVEKLRTEPKTQPLRQLKLPLQSDVSLPRSKTSQHIAAEITLRPRGR